MLKFLRKERKRDKGAYLDDGTMIVVDNGKRHMGKTIDVVVTSVLQTPAGRMIFARLKEEGAIGKVRPSVQERHRGRGRDFSGQGIPADSAMTNNKIRRTHEPTYFPFHAWMTSEDILIERVMGILERL